jgi:hypothetical protein
MGGPKRRFPARAVGTNEEDVAMIARIEASVALLLCTTAHPLYNIFAKIFGASVSEAAMRPNPRRAAARC